ncbi:MAG: hypothetical protein ACKVOG_10310 [Rhodoglobus sp.]
MTETLHFDDVSAVALDTDDEIVARVRDLLRNAIRHQVWLMFLDAHRQQLPVIMPTDVPPAPSDDDPERIGAFICELAGELEASTVIVTYERVGAAELSDVDRVWLRALHEACENSQVAFSGPHLCHRRGVRAVEPADYLL